MGIWTVASKSLVYNIQKKIASEKRDGVWAVVEVLVYNIQKKIASIHLIRTSLTSLATHNNIQKKIARSYNLVKVYFFVYFLQHSKENSKIVGLYVEKQGAIRQKQHSKENSKWDYHHLACVDYEEAGPAQHSKENSK